MRPRRKESTARRFAAFHEDTLVSFVRLFAASLVGCSTTPPQAFSGSKATVLSGVIRQTAPSITSVWPSIQELRMNLNSRLASIADELVRSGGLSLEPDSYV